MTSRDGGYRTAMSLLVLMGVAIGLHLYAVRVKDVKPSRSLPETTLSRTGKTTIRSSQSRRIQQLIRR
ncbi:hypothetical protein [Synechococcus sp. 8F6]|uniref:hypothetical protein n=1 Tax=Synechococcus sp. 8F6 TaxID=2025606 RepID=UPI000B984C1C|nr:hypothetical protein [Synechococcus sp. 8F6]